MANKSAWIDGEADKDYAIKNACIKNENDADLCKQLGGDLCKQLGGALCKQPGTADSVPPSMMTNASYCISNNRNIEAGQLPASVGPGRGLHVIQTR